MGFEQRKKSGNIFAGSRLVVDGQGIYNVKILKFGPERQKSPLEFFRPIVVPQPIPAPLCDFNGVIFMTPTPTPTNTPTNTVTPTVTPTFPLCGVQLNSVNYISGTTWQYNFVSSVQCSTLSIQYSTDNLNWTTSSGGCTSPRTWDIGIQTDTIYFRVIQICSSGGPTTSNVISYTFPTPTPTVTPTSTLVKSFEDLVYRAEKSLNACGQVQGGLLSADGNGTTFCNSTTLTSSGFIGLQAGELFISYNGQVRTSNHGLVGDNFVTFTSGCNPCN
jgi:hypothetical protein